MPWHDWHPLKFLNYMGKNVYHTYTKRQSGERQHIVKYLYSTDNSSNPNSEYAFDVRELENPLGLDIESPLNQMKIVSYAIEKGKIKFPEEQFQKEVNFGEYWIKGNRQPILDLLALERNGDIHASHLH